MSKLDKLIQEALNDEDREILKGTEELGYFNLGLSLFRGKLGWVTWAITLLQSVMVFSGAWCIYNFFVASDVLVALKWGLSGASLWIIRTSIKMSLAPQMQAERILRELKRVELLIVSHRNDGT